MGGKPNPLPATRFPELLPGPFVDYMFYECPYTNRFNVGFLRSDGSWFTSPTWGTDATHSGRIRYLNQIGEESEEIWLRDDEGMAEVRQAAYELVERWNYGCKPVVHHRCVLPRVMEDHGGWREDIDLIFKDWTGMPGCLHECLEALLIKRHRDTIKRARKSAQRRAKIAGDL